MSSTSPLPFALDRPIDCIIYGDVLEHLSDPWPVLRRHAEALSDDGTMLICVPNMEHWSFADRLLRGTWKYEPTGLLDETHLRWFSLETMREGLEALGLVPLDVHRRASSMPTARRQFAGMIAPALTALGVDPQAYAQRAAPLQYIWRVRKTPRQMMTVAANMLQPVGGVSHVRVVYPLQALRSDPTVLTQLVDRRRHHGAGQRHAAHLRAASAALSGERGAAVIRTLLADGWLIVTEFDDHPDHFGMLNADDQFAFRGVHAVQTSTPALAAILRTLNPEVTVFPNMVRALPDVRNFRDPQVLTLFFGALNRERDWAPLMPALNEVAEKAGDRLRFRVVHDQAFLRRAAHAAQTVHADLRLRHLHGTARGVRDLVHAAGGHAVQSGQVRSEVHRGRRVPRCGAGEPHRLCRQHRGWPNRAAVPRRRELRDRLLRLVAMPELARGLGDAARHYVAGERMLAYQVAPRIAWYRSLWARRAELTSALYARLLELPLLADGAPVEMGTLP